MKKKQKRKNNILNLKKLSLIFIHMNEKRLLQTLASLKSVGPRADWVKQNREVLSYQIFNGQESSPLSLSFFNRFHLFAHRLLQPSAVAALIVVFFIVSGVVSINASKGSTPKDVLYVAKMISEKAEFAVAFDEETKAELNVRYAQNRAAELNQLIKETNGNEADPRVQELSDNFKKEIAAVRERLHKLDEEAAKQATIEAQGQVKPKLNLNAKKNEEATEEKNSETEASEEVFSADSGKDEKGIQISMPTVQVLDEVEKLFNEKNYDQAIDKLGEIQIK